jgi:hypothetical protein
MTFRFPLDLRIGKSPSQTFVMFATICRRLQLLLWRLLHAQLTAFVSPLCCAVNLMPHFKKKMREHIQLFSKKNTPFDRVVLLDFYLPLFDGESPLLHRDDVPMAVRVEPISAFSRRPLFSSSPGSVTGFEIALK